MKNIFYKKWKKFFFISGFLLVCAGLLLLAFKLRTGKDVWPLLFEQKAGNAPAESKALVPPGGGKTQTPCRELSATALGDINKESASENRIQKLERLMNKPIDWVLRDINGNVIDLYCFRGKKIVILNLWASWCPPCIQELPSLSRLAEKHHKQIAVIAVSSESKDTVKNFLKQAFSDLSPHFKIAHADKEDKLKYFPEDQLPVTYIFNRKGLLKVKEQGARDWSKPHIIQQILQIP